MKQNPKNAAATAAPHPAMPMRVRKLSHVVADALRIEIAAGQLNPGDQLMPEAELLQHFGVSRPTLREALRVVESEGLIQLGRGARTGATVLGPSIEIAARYGTMYLAVEKTTLGDVHQVRTLLEPLTVGALDGHPWAEWARPEAHEEGGRLPGAVSRWNATKDLSWVPLRLERVAEVAYQTVTNGRFRGVASFVRWREDRDPASCRYDQLVDPAPLGVSAVLTGGAPR